MQEIFDKLKKRIMICATEACGYTPLTRVVSEAELKDIIEQIAAEYSNGHFGCNTNGEHERCNGCGLTNCKSRNKIWFGVVGDGTDTNVGSNGWIPCSERVPKVEDLHEKSVDDCTCYLIQRRCGIMDVAHYIKVYGEPYFEANSIKMKDVVAWQPLPDPYQPKGE